MMFHMHTNADVLFTLDFDTEWQCERPEIEPVWKNEKIKIIGAHTSIDWEG